MSTTTVKVRAYDGSIVGEESQFSKLDVILRHQDVASWAVTMPDTAMAAQLQQPGAGISIHRNGHVLVSGPMTKVERVYSDTQDQFVISGLSDECYLWDRVVQPTNPAPLGNNLYQFDQYDLFNGVAETTIKHYVTANLLDPTRAVSGAPQVSVATDQGRGLAVVGQGRMQLLGDFINTFTVYSNNMGFTVNDLVFDIYEPVDLSASAYFSVDSGNIISYSYTFSAPKVTHPVVGGAGQDDQRIYYITGDDAAATTWGRRIESFIDSRSTSDPTQLAQSSQTAITNGAAQTAVTLLPRDVPNRTFGKDYNLGDIAKIQGVTATISQVELTLDQNGETIAPTGSSIGTAAALNVLTIFDNMRAIRRQLLDLQTGY